MTKQDLLDLQRIRAATASGRARLIRQAAGLSQSEIAEVVGVAQSTIALWETAKRRPRGTAAVRYARILKELAPRSGPEAA